VDPYENDDQTERLKKWWSNYGRSLILGIVLGSAALGGIKYWQHYQAERAEAASQLYEQMMLSFQKRAAAGVDETGNKLMQDYAATPYAGKAALTMAKMRFDVNDIETARRHLQWALDKASETATRQVARLRLARLLLDRSELDAALELTNVKDQAG